MKSARSLAAEALSRIFLGSERADSSLFRLAPGLPDARDRAFMMELVYGVLRERGLLDWALAHFLKKPGGLHPETVENLRLGVFQLWRTDAPEWAVVSEAVKAERHNPGLVNGVLRNFIREKTATESRLESLKARALSADAPDAERTRLVSIIGSHPEWLVKRWLKRFGPEEALSLCGANNRQPSITLRVNALRIQRDGAIEKLRKAGINGTPTECSPTGIRLEKGADIKAVFSNPELSGLLSVQDEAAMLPAYMLNPLPEHAILDTCSAPGGKAAQMSEMTGDSAEITAVDIDERRLGLVRDNASRLGLKSIKTAVSDISNPGPELRGKTFDRILLDAPCSSIGVIRRDPDVKYRRDEKSLAHMAERQLKLLSSASAMLRPGGRILYAVCSTEPDEAEAVVKEFLKHDGKFIIIEDAAEFPDFLRRFVRDGFMRTFPHRDDMDGFFGALICKAKK